jgi:hypothetical protein
MNAEHSTSPDPVGHAPITADTRAITFWLVGLLGAIAASLAVVAGLVWFFARINHNVLAESSVPVAQERRDLAPEVPPSVPALDAHLADELVDLRAREHQLLSQYAWIDRESGVARIPIRRAMQILAQRATQSTSQQSKDGASDE